ncbi:hypothetical protein QO010_004216 [Caulobacter ginsengisoli]|uniref:Secreted protein n=1 Tax=Caulobacter ginsengisoli TaxID=400775 RepID=A0ABU0IZ12_9CAUL|nr:hypothetical protein [Caulobacter ginsengisoli]MDQ0466423.1 hypothetical protein [Caulobacter ginsengisoli]
MRTRFSRAAAAAVLALAFLAPALPASAREDRIFYLYNSNGSVSIQRVWTALAGDKNDAWTPATLNSPVDPGETTSFSLGEGASCFYDVKVQFSDSYEQTFANVNVCRADKVTAT